LFLLLAATQNWFMKSLGLGEDIPPDAQAHFEWSGAPQSWWMLLLIGIACLLGYGVFFVYRRENSTCPRVVKLLLTVSRCLVLLLLLLVFLVPTLTYSTFRTRYPYVVLVRDASQSMNTLDEYSDPTDAAKVASATGMSVDKIRSTPPSRVSVVNELLKKNDGEFIRQLQQHGKLRVIDFADKARQIEVRPALPAEEKKKAPSADIAPETPLAPLVAGGRASKLHSALEESLSSKPLAAIVLITDGQHTGSSDPEELAFQAKKMGVPFFILGVGDPKPAHNVSVAKVFARRQVWQNEPFEIEAVIKAEGYQQQNLRVELIEQEIGSSGEPGAETVVKTQQVTIPDEGGLVRTSFQQTVRESGTYVYSVRVETIAGERKTNDNRLTSSQVKVLDREQIRVLLVSGAPSWEYQMLQRLLTRDKTISLSCWLQTLDLDRPQEGDVPISELPQSREKLFQYDVVLLLDPNPQEFDEAWIELLKKFASEHSGGVFYMAGPKFSGSFLTGGRTAAMKDILPIRFGDVGAMQVATLLSTNRTAWPLKVVASQADHQVMSFYSDRQESLARWESLPGIFWSFPASKPKPTAQVLVEHSDPTLSQLEGPRPLIVTGRYGAGNTMYLGFNGTWRWRRVGRKAEFFDRFWINTVRFLVESRSLEGNRHAVVQTDKDLYEIGDRATVTAQLTDASYQPLTLEEVEAVLETPEIGPTPITLILRDQRPGEYEAVFTTRRIGDHTIRVKLPSPKGDEPPTAETTFSVELPRVETSQAWLNKPLLINLAKKSGGKYFEVDQFQQIAAAIPDATEAIEVQGKPHMLWSTWPVLLLLVLLLSFEWGMRKVYKLL